MSIPSEQEIPLNITTSIEFLDCIDEYKIEKLLVYPYFHTLLTKYNKITKEISTIIDANGIKRKAYIYTIPHVKINYNKSIFKKLTSGKPLDIRKPYDDTMIELFSCNNEYLLYKKIGWSSWGFRPFYCIDILPFIKNNIPTINVYHFLGNGCFSWTDDLIYYSFRLCAKGKLYPNIVLDREVDKWIEYAYIGIYDSHKGIIDDLLEIIYTYTNCIIQLDDFKTHKVINNILETLLWCCKNDEKYISIIKKYIDTETCIKLLNTYAKCWKYKCMHGKIRYQKSSISAKMIKKFITHIEKVFDIVKEIITFGIFDMERIGDVNKYKEKINN